jgi:hypothetical protein
MFDPKKLPRLVWVWTPAGKRQQVWVDAGEPDPPETNLRRQPTKLIRGSSPTSPVDEVALSDLLQR